MFKHCYMPQSMINSVIIPIIKNKSGDFTDKNNYRPIALSSIISKVFEHTIVNHLDAFFLPFFSVFLFLHALVNNCSSLVYFC